jgi:hypothetical protein
MAKVRSPQVVTLSEPLRILTPRQIAQIDRCLADLEEFGRITLVKRNGKLRFIEKTESIDAMHPDH